MKTPLKDLIKSLREHFAADTRGADDVQPDDTKPAGIEFKSKDGKSFKVGKMEVGEAVEMADADGNFVPATDGDIEAEDGSIITIKDGKIEAIKPAEAPTDKPAADATPAGFNAEDFVSKAEFQTVSNQLAEVNKTLAGLKTAFEANKKTLSTMFEVVEVISNESEATPTDAGKGKVFDKKTTEKENARKALKAAFAAAGK